MINYETLISSYDDKLTLLQWLKKVEDALKNSVLTDVSTAQEGEEVTFTFSFEDGTKIISSPVKVNQQVDDAHILNGHLFIHLADGEEIDAGNLFEGNVQMDGEFTASGLKATGTGVETGVLKTNGTALDVFATEVNINTDVFAQGSIESETSIKTPVLTSDEDEINAQKPVVEVMNGYSFATDYVSGTTYDIGVTYAGAVKNGNKLTLSLAFTIKRKSDTIDNYFPIVGKFTIPSSIFNSLVPDVDNLLDAKRVILLTGATDTSPVSLVMSSVKYMGKIHIQLGRPYQIPLNSVFYSRYEVTFLLSENLAA